jgi:predicted enzyme related to lactoylglutathione lyase
MKRSHVHVAVDDLAANVRFYSSVFGADSKSEKAPIDADKPAQSAACCAPRSKVTPVAGQPVKACC